MKLCQLFEDVVPHVRRSTGYVVLVVDETDATVLQEQLPNFPQHIQPSVEQAVGYIKQYHDSYYQNTKINEVPKEHWPGTDDSIFNVDIPKPVNGKVYGLYDPREQRKTFWLPDSYLWIVSTDNIPSDFR